MHIQILEMHMHAYMHFAHTIYSYQSIQSVVTVHQRDNCTPKFPQGTRNSILQARAVTMGHEYKLFMSVFQHLLCTYANG